MQQTSCNLFCIAAVALVMCLACCGNRLKAGDPETPMGGVALEILRTDGRSSHALYSVESNGTLSFGGGFDALRDRITWTAAMTTEQIAGLRALLEEHSWFERAPMGAGGDNEVIHEITFASPRASWRARVRGGGPRLDPILEFLREASLSRHDDLLDSLPQPNSPPDSGQ